MKPMVPREEAIKRTIELLSKQYPKAEKADKKIGFFLKAFPAGVIPDYDNDGQLSQINTVPNESIDHLTELLPRAGTDPQAFHVLMAWASVSLLRGEKIPDLEISQFIANVLAGNIVAPKKGGRPPKEKSHQLRHGILRLAVSQLEEMGFQKTRGDETLHKETACDIVAEAMVKLKFSPRTFGQIERILREGDRVAFS